MRIIKATLEHLDLLAPLFVKYREFYGQLPYPDSSRSFLEKRLDTGVRVRYSSGNGENLNQQGYELMDQAMWPKYTLYDLYASYWMTDQLNIALALENATDEAYFVAMGDANNLSLARGRTLSGMLEYKF